MTVNAAMQIWCYVVGLFFGYVLGRWEHWRRFGIPLLEFIRAYRREAERRRSKICPLCGEFVGVPFIPLHNHQRGHVQCVRKARGEPPPWRKEP